MNMNALHIGPIRTEPLPQFNPSYPCSKVALALSALQIGQCRDFDWPEGAYPRSFQAYVLRIAKSANIEVTTRKTPKGLTVWRIDEETASRVKRKYRLRWKPRFDTELTAKL